MSATPAWPPRSAPRLFVKGELAAGQQRAIEGPQAHYLGRVMRVGEGDAVILCDNFSGEWAARVVTAGKREVVLEIADHLRPREDVPDFTLCPALLKKPRFDQVLEKATELGVAKIRPVITRRCVADALNMDRARTVITEAAEQCSRTALPELFEPQPLAQFLREWPEDAVLWFADEQGPEDDTVPPAATAFAERWPPAGLLIGPEGGFDDAERDLVRDHLQARPVSLGPRILRAETAAIAATAVWMAAMGDWTGSAET
ncbi:16S rRNA (uracil(1498)-N(3))-methyltransferase [Croceicoccus naphthovorans]|uniref:Ribosomal RNA small subunit methyltransferase E n=1 Tax=Croceicoccus naphthovorans TaxID=1348774 RepID=A0A0G3XIV4_9SPHN|nr:16S rRNA (uracil(1498)-N(3))-methyltransferase [Croceicoccus naphthovorans]AKM10531.1 16S rRNA methyltransferase [Croceicoccus naphthovorans]MBB3988727.1 16S rRNA (uracil1498-N3)-methyltransferase [Croceicoccus naphthovorans]